MGIEIDSLNLLERSIVAPFLNEENKETIAIYPGAFKPPHRGHLAVLEKANAIADKTIVLISSAPREDVEAEESLKIWELYTKDMPNVEVKISERFSPVAEAYSLFKHNPEKNFNMVIGKGEVNRLDNLKKYINAKPFDAGTFEDLSATRLRKAIREGDTETIQRFIPENISVEEYLGAFDQAPVNESTFKTNPNIKDLKVKQKVRYKGKEGIIKKISNNKVFIEIYTSGGLEKITIANASSKGYMGGDFETIQSPVNEIGDEDLNSIAKKMRDRTIATALGSLTSNWKEINSISDIKVGDEVYDSNKHVPQGGIGRGGAFARVVQIDADKITLQYDEDRKWKETKTKKINDFLDFFLVRDKSINEDQNSPYYIIQSLRTGSPKYIFNIDSDKPSWVRDSNINKAFKFNTLEDAKNYLSKFDPKRTEFWHIYKTPSGDVGLGPDLKESEENVNEDCYPEHFLQDSITSFAQYMEDSGMQIAPPPRVEFVNDDEENAEGLFGKTAYYNPEENVIVLYTLGRHPKDILRSFAHEMIHHIQNLEGRLGNITTTNTNEDDYLDQIEREAYEHGNMTFRNWTDSILHENINENDISSFANQLADEIEDELEDHENELNEVVGIVGIIGWILLSNTVANMLSKFAKKISKKYNWGKGEEAAAKIEKWTHDNEESFKTPIKRVVGLFTKNEKWKKNITDVLYAIMILMMAGQAGGDAVNYVKKAGYLKGGIYSLKTLVKGKEVHHIIKDVISNL